MKSYKKIISKLTAVLVVIGLSVPQANNSSVNLQGSKEVNKTVMAGITDPLTAPTNDDWLHTVGNKIVDKNGNQVWLTGTNWFGFNTGTNCFDGLWSCNLEEALSSMADRGINFLRIPISVEIVNQWAKGVYPTPNVNLYVNPNLTGKTSLDILDITVRDCKTYGIKIMFDIHSAKTDAMGHMYPLWYNGTITTENFYQSLEWLTNRYKNDDTVLAMDLKNEPHGKAYQEPANSAIWDNSTSANNWRNAAQTAAQRILAINPNMLIMVEGVESFPKSGFTYASTNEADYYNNWWGGNLRGVANYPVNLGTNQKQLVYSPHDYGPSVFKQPWFYAGFTKETLYNDCWRDNWAYIHDKNIAPLLIGEWGGFMDGGDNQKWMTYLRDFMIERKISHTFWCFNANSGDTGGLVQSDFKTWDEAKYALLKPALWQNTSGKFIGLDHVVAIGRNGITVSEYYGSNPVNDSTISPTTATFDKNSAKQADIPVTMALNGNTFVGIKNGSSALAAGSDYTVSGTVITITKAYLARQPLGTTQLTFDFSAGADPALNITIIDSTLQKVAAPTFSVPAGTYTAAQTVSLSCATTGAAIRYTLDGTTPTATSPLYSAPISITQTTTIKAFAAKSGMTNSDVVSATYTISAVQQAAAPTFSIPGGTYNTAQTVSLSCATTGATIRYTVDGTTPTASSAAYSGPITVAKTTTIKAIALKSGMTNSNVASATYTITPLQSSVIVTYAVVNDWGNGATINVTVKNNGTSAINGWTLAWTLPNGQSIANMWNATYSISGSTISCKNLDYNATIGANGGTQSFGFNINYSGTNVKPTSFTLNGAACQVQ